jgi:hypothetical protein
VRFQAFLNGTDVSRRFGAARGGQRVAVFGRAHGLQAGVNNLALTARSRAGRTVWVFRRFVLAQRAPTALPGALFAGESSSAPLKVTLGTLAFSRPTLQATLNGRRIDGAFGSSSPRQTAMLGANDGVRFGLNALRLAVYDENGAYDVQTRRFYVPRSRPLAGAGPDRTLTVSQTVRLDGSSSRAARGGKLSFRWQIVSQPGSAQATLRGATSVRPSLRTNRIGIYLVRLTVLEQPRGRGLRVAQKQDLVSIDALPSPFPTAAVSFTSLDGRGRMLIDGAPVPSTGGSNVISLVVIRRSDRAIVSSSNAFNPSKAGIDRLRDAVDKVVDGDGEKDLVAITGTAGVSPGAVDEFASILGRIGARIAPDDRDGIAAGKRFSVLGIPFSPAGSAFISVDRAQGDPCDSYSPEGELSGYLQLQYSTVPATYGLVFGRYPHFDTSVVGSPAKGNTISVGGVRYTATLSQGTAGFHIVALDRRTLEPLQVITGQPLDPCADLNFAVPVNTGNLATDAMWQSYLGGLLKDVVEKQGLILIQSIGTPKPTTAAWTQIAEQIGLLGGSPAVFNAIGRTASDPSRGVYALVASDGMDAPAAEASQPLTGRPGHLGGMLELSNRAIYQPLLADSVTGTFNERLIDIAYQQPQAFQPAFTTPGERNADRWLSSKLHLTPGDVRADFVLDFSSADWPQAATELNDAAYPGPLPEHPFSAGDLAKVKTALKDDLSAFNRVRTYMTQVARPLEDSKLATYVSLRAIGQQIQDTIKPPQESDATARALGLVSSIVGVGKSLPEVGPLVSVFSSVFSLASALATPAGAQIGGDISAQVSDLGPRLVDRFDAASRGLTGLTLLIVGDGGKLSSMAARLNDPDWKLSIDAPSQAADAIRKGAARWFYSSLMPAAYQLWQLRGVTSANDYQCKSAGQQKVFASEPPNGQDLQTVGFTASAATPDQVVVALGRDINFHAAQPFARTPPASLTDPLFQPADQPIRYPNGLAMYKPQFLSSINFPIHIAPSHRSDCS